MQDYKLAFVDIETTGLYPQRDKIIEIGVIRYENGQITRKFHSLLNPQTYLPPEITRLTNISEYDLENMPTFRQIKNDILSILENCIFVAHNARFDYNFIKNEFKKISINYRSKQLCTLKLSRTLYPKYSHHNLDSIIQRHNLNSPNRHRALSDAQAIFDFYLKIQKDFPENKIKKTIKQIFNSSSIPSLLKTDIKQIPQKPGIYIFYGPNNSVLYVGKSKNISKRISSHFNSDINLPTEMKIKEQIEKIETIETPGEFGALILENKLIKELQPFYNRKSRIKKELYLLKSTLNKNGYLEINAQKTSNLTPQDLQNIKNNFTSPQILGLFKSRLQAKNFVSQVTNKYNLCNKLTGQEKTNNACFAYHLKKCKGACIGKEKNTLYNLRFIVAFTVCRNPVPWPYKNAIVINDENSDKNEYFLINHWCVLGKSNLLTNTFNEFKLFDNPIFDPDTYLIIRQFILNPQNKDKIITCSISKS